MTRMSQTDTIHKHLNIYGSITTWEAIEQYHITRLSAHIQFLEERGVMIDPIKKSDGKKHWVEYRLMTTPQQSFL